MTITQTPLPKKPLREVALLPKGPSDLPLDFETDADELDEFEWAAIEVEGQPYVVLRYRRSPEDGAVLWADPQLQREEAVRNFASAIDAPELTTGASWVAHNELRQIEEADFEGLHPRDRLGRWVRKLGIPAYKVGGAVRDPLLGKEPDDVDYVLMATPDRIRDAVKATGHRAQDLIVRDRVVGIRAYGPELPEEGVELAPPRIEVSTGPERHDFVIRSHPGLEPTESQVPDDQRAYIAEGAMVRHGHTGRQWHIPVGKMEDGRALGSYGPKAVEASVWASGVAGFPVRVIATTYWPEAGENDVIHASADRMQRQINVHPDTDELTILHEVAHLMADDPGHGEQWQRIVHRLYREHLGPEAAQVFGTLMFQDDPSAMLADDAQRRDFTANALYQDAETEAITDPTGTGVEDAKNLVLRTTSPQSFREDPLRILRGLRFMSQHGMELAPETRQQMSEHAHRTQRLTTKKGGTSGTAVKELNKMLMGDHVGQALRTMRDTGVMQHFLPELAPVIGFDQESKYHDLPLDEHIISAVENAAAMGAPLEVRLALLFHDAGKPDVAWRGEDGRLHYYANAALGKEDHAVAGAGIARSALNRLNYDDATKSAVVRLVEEHMMPEAASTRAVKARQLRARVGDELLPLLFMHRRADMTAKGEGSEGATEGLDRFEQLVREQMDAPVSRGDLAITGADLIALGIEGPAVGRILALLVKHVISDPNLNTKDRLLALARRLLMEEASYRESDHPRDRLGRWRNLPSAPSLDDVMREMGAFEMEHGREHRPEAYEIHPESGFEVRKRDVPITKLVTRMPEKYLDFGGEGEFPMVADMVPGPLGMGEQPVSEPRPLEFAFRAVSEEDYQQMSERGYMLSDQRMNLGDEGTVAAMSNPTFYLPGGLASNPHGDYEGRILKIRLRPEDGWKYDRDGYLKTHQHIPMDRIVDVSPVIVTRKGDVPSSVTGNPIGVTRRHVWWPDLEAELPPLPVTATWEPRTENVDAQGRYHLFHGTSVEGAAKIRQGGMTIRPGLGPGWQIFTTNREQAERYALGWAEQGETVVLEFAIPLDHARRYLTAPIEHGAYDFDADSHGLIVALPAKYLVDGVEEAFDEGEHPRNRLGRFRRVWHITDKADFKLDPEYKPVNNTTLGGEWPEPGVFAASDIEPWFNGYDYVRPFAVELDVPSDIEFHGYSGETFIPATRFGETKVRRVIPIDEYVREVFRDSGWIEDFENPPSMFERPEPLPEGYRYSGPDVREMSPEQVEDWRRRVEAYIKALRPHMMEAFDPNQPRWPKGHPKAGQWRPKIAARGGRLGPQGMANDLFYLKNSIRAMKQAGIVNPSPERLAEIGREIEKLARRYSTREAYAKRLSSIRDERTKLQDRYWGEYEAIFDDWKARKQSLWDTLPDTLSGEQLDKAFAVLGPMPEVEDFIGEDDQARLKAINAEEIKLVQSRARAERDALLGVLNELRPMGGKAIRFDPDEPITVDSTTTTGDRSIHVRYAEKGTYARGMQDDLYGSLREVRRLIPRDWITELNEKGTMQWHFSDQRANHGFRPDPQANIVRAALRGESEWVGWYESGGNRYPILKRPPIWPGGEPLYDWVNDRGHMRNVALSGSDGGLPGFKLAKVEQGDPPSARALGRIRVRPDDQPVILHELMHHFEAIIGDPLNNGYRPLNNFSLNFMQRRTKGQDAYRLKDVAGNFSGYRDDEKTKPDRFFDPYVGKQYGYSGHTEYDHSPTEVLTMGMQYLWYPTFRNPLEDEDPEHRYMMLGILGAV